MGIGGLARPMVVGDRLWLFSQTAAGPTPIQSIMLNGAPTAPLNPTPLRTFGSNPMPSPVNTSTMAPHHLPGASVMESARNAILARGQPLNFAVPYKPAPYVPARLPLKPYGSFQDYQQMSGYRASNSEMVSDAYLQLKYAAMNNISVPAENESQTSNGLAELERVFGGDSNVNFLEQNHLKNAEGKYAVNNISNGKSEDDSESSDIDCEQLDEDEE